MLKNLFILSSLLLSTSLFAKADLDKVFAAPSYEGNINIPLCKSCHGADWEKAALGSSKIVAQMTKEEVSEALIGYKNGTYGGAMKGVMHSNVVMYTDEELRNSGIGLDTAVVRAEFNPNIDIKSCKACHGVDWEKAALGYSKIVANMSKKEVSEALLGYKNGTYGRAMKGVMHTNVKMYKDEDLLNSGIGLDKKLDIGNFNPNIDIQSCKACHGSDWEKAALGTSKIVANMTKEEVTKALLGYKNGTYGRAMKGVMCTNIKMYSDEDLKNSGIGK